MRRILLVGAVVILLAVLTAMPCVAAKAKFVPLDYDSNGIYDCQYQVSEKHSNGGWCISVSYFSFSYEYLGQELWTDYWGLMKDTFEPWTYPFPVS